uniref:mRNA export factor GLE1 n=1 Tax=Neogobius melanostomus TaxID=47308 RepID=A0A8C6TXK0_9GOBI
MQADGLRWETIEALKNSPKGKLHYDPHWSERGEDILEGYHESPSLSSYSAAVVERLSSVHLQKSRLSSGSGESSPGFSEEVHNSFSSSSILSFNNRNNALSTVSTTSPLAVRWRQEEQEKLVAAVVSSESEQLKRFEELMELKQRQDLQSVRDMMDRETKESIGRQEKLKEEQRHRMKILNLRLREAEQQRLREAELEKQRQAEGRERLRSLNSIQEEVLQLNQVLNAQQGPSEVPAQNLASLCQRGNQLCSQVSEVVRKTTEGDFPSVEDMTVAERALHDMRALIRLQQEEVTKAQEKKKKEVELEEQRRKEEEQKAKQEAEKKAADAAKEKAKKTGLQAEPEDSTLKWFKELQDTAASVAKSFEDFSSTKDPKTKKLKLELMKAAVIPVSQISTKSGSHLREIFEKIEKLMSGKSVQSGGMTVSATHHPQGLQFASYKLAEKFVKQGEEEVASHFEAAFPIAAVASGVWELHPAVGELFLAHLHKKCPYSIPYLPQRKHSASAEEHHRRLGYRVDDSGVEGEDSFLKRMSGMIRLYAAIIQIRWPYGSKQGPAPHGLNHGWRWLAQMLNLEPLADTTATLLFDFLEVCGNALMKQYQGQFWKLILLLKEEYLDPSRGQMCERGVRIKQSLTHRLRSSEFGATLPPLLNHKDK